MGSALRAGGFVLPATRQPVQALRWRESQVCSSRQHVLKPCSVTGGELSHFDSFMSRESSSQLPRPMSVTEESYGLLTEVSCCVPG